MEVETHCVLRKMIPKMNINLDMIDRKSGSLFAERVLHSAKCSSGK